jgi:hypothetical protein
MRLCGLLLFRIISEVVSAVERGDPTLLFLRDENTSAAVADVLQTLPRTVLEN